LRLAARQPAGGAIEGEVVEAHVEQEREAVADLLEHLAGDLSPRAGELEPFVERVRVLDRHAGDGGDRRVGDQHRPRLGSQPGAEAGHARHRAEERLVVGARAVRRALAMPALELGQDALVLHGPLAARVLALPRHRDALVARAVHQQVAVLVAELAPRLLEVDLEGLGQRLDDVGGPAGVLGHRVAPDRDGPVLDALARVGDDQLRVGRQLLAEAVARHAHAERRVERERLR
jgi:hypothetical protein